MRAISLLACLPLLACDPAIPSIGTDLRPLFPSLANHFWKFDNDGRTEISYWINVGETSPVDGETATTFRIWVGQEQATLEDIVGDQLAWNVDVHFVETTDGWHLGGWNANPTGDSVSFGDVWFDDPIPMLGSNVTRGRRYETDAGGASWYTENIGEEGPLEFNGQQYDDAWHITLTSSIGNFPFEGDYWFKGGPGLIQWDVVGFRPETGQPWTHIHNDVLDNISGND